MHPATPSFNVRPLAHGRPNPDTTPVTTRTKRIHLDENVLMTDNPAQHDAPADAQEQVPASDPPPLRTLDLRVARVQRARSHPNADRLLVLDIDLGDEQRQIVAGIAAHYHPDDLADLHIVVVANLAPARLRGEISQGMLLAAQNDDTLGLLLAPEAAPGTRLTAGTEAPGTISIDQFAAHELRATPDAVTLDGEPIRTAKLAVDRGVTGKLR